MFLLKVGLFFLALIIVDRALGWVFAYMGDHAKGGYVGHHVYVTDKANEDILIFGSSRAIHHYNPQIISDSLGMTCYNCGQDGNGIVLFYGMWQMIKERYHPKMIIYDVTPDFDLIKGESNQKYLGWLRSDYDRPGVKPIFELVDPVERYKMMSMLYRYNSKFMQNIIDYMYPLFRFEDYGFLPLIGEMDMMKIRERGNNPVTDRELDSLKLFLLNKLIDEVEGKVEIVFVVSPSWYEQGDDDYYAIKDICKQKKIRFLDYTNHKKYVHQQVWFKDGSHLNSLGAEEFTRDLVIELRNK